MSTVVYLPSNQRRAVEKSLICSMSNYIYLEDPLKIAMISNPNDIDNYLRKQNRTEIAMQT